MQGVPTELLDLALNTLDEEVKCWRRLPWAPGKVRLMRFPTLSEEPIGVSEFDAESTQTVIMHDVDKEIADDLIVRFAMEKVLETVIGAISVGSVDHAD
jgi:hypothetical protein